MGSSGSKASTNTRANDDCANSECGGLSPRASDLEDAISRESSFSVDVDAFMSPREDGCAASPPEDIQGRLYKSANRGEAARATAAALEATAAAAAAALAARDLLLVELERKRRRGSTCDEEDSFLTPPTRKRRRAFMRKHTSAVALRKGFSRRMQRLQLRRALLEGALQSRKRRSETCPQSPADTQDEYRGKVEAHPPEEKNLNLSESHTQEETYAEKRSSFYWMRSHAEPLKENAPPSSVESCVRTASENNASPVSAHYSNDASSYSVCFKEQKATENRGVNPSSNGSTNSSSRQAFARQEGRGTFVGWGSVRCLIESFLRPLEVQKAAAAASAEVWQNHGKKITGRGEGYFCLCEALGSCTSSSAMSRTSFAEVSYPSHARCALAA